ncbi:MAG: hypothetical protein ACYDCY_09455, partial [Metallibacterium sp.]
MHPLLARTGFSNPRRIATASESTGTNDGAQRPQPDRLKSDCSIGLMLTDWTVIVGIHWFGTGLTAAAAGY